jgi:hypothetical protein
VGHAADDKARIFIMDMPATVTNVAGMGVSGWNAQADG